jgi:seryl-tRNA synthetase
MPPELARRDDGSHPDLRWRGNQAVLGGTLLALYRRLDAAFTLLGTSEAAAEVMYPTLLGAAHLAKLDYFKSFPHLATFACNLDRDPDNLGAFARGAGLDERGGVALTALEPVTQVLTPAACYHVYVDLAERELSEFRTVTTRATCFRREAHYAPLERQWSFGMREVVGIGAAEDVKAFLARGRLRVAHFVEDLGLSIEWLAATDPFFDASRNPKFLAQKLDPVKTEMVHRGRLAIGSINFHRNFFGDTFAIDHRGEPAFSGCIAFGLERWIRAILDTHGPDAAAWPDIEVAAQEAFGG